MVNYENIAKYLFEIDDNFNKNLFLNICLIIGFIVIIRYIFKIDIEYFSGETKYINLQLNIPKLNNKIIKYVFMEDNTIFDIKNYIELSEKISKKYQKIYFKENELNDNDTIKKLNLVNNNALTIIY